jgi:hypothetical protein
MKQFSVQTITRVSASRVQRGPIGHVTDPAQIEYPLTGDFRQGEYDAIVDGLQVGQSHVFIQQAAEYDTHLLDRFSDIRTALRTSVRVHRVR